jgi:DNA (cytosine-5)-methyltransferase 1
MAGRVVSVFSGIGGFELGFQGLGFEIAMMCDIDPAARAVLSQRFPGTRITSDVTRLRKLPPCDVVVGGWPCQDLSQAGRTAGISGSRSGLVNEVFRLIDAAPEKPAVVLLENVAFALSLKKGQAIRHVVAELQARGYRWAYRVLDSLEFGLPQRRRRVFVCAALADDPWQILFDGIAELTAPTEDPRHVGFYWTEGNRGLGWTSGAIPPLKGGSSISIPSPPAIWDRLERSFTTPTIEDAERFQGFPCGWTEPAAVATGSDRPRWRLVGNAVSVGVSKWLGRRLQSPRESEIESDLPWVENCGQHNAAKGGPGRTPQYLPRCPEGPRVKVKVTLEQLSYASGTPLSARAAKGFLMRYKRSGLKKDERLLHDLEHYCSTFSGDTFAERDIAPAT